METPEMPELPNAEEMLPTQPDSIPFSVDAGLINRLGMELVGRSETAVSELIKNAYDADATLVEVLFENTDEVGGTLIIDDNGEGMDIEELRKGFMRLSSTDKVHNPTSKKFNRQRAGRKGIGRFATQRLGDKLTIITKKEGMSHALKLVVDWTAYKMDTELSSIGNIVEYITPLDKKQFGTKLIIENLREKWTEADIRRVYRYASELLQPDFLSDRSKNLKIGNQNDASFKTQFFTGKKNESPKLLADPEKMIFDKAVAVITGVVDAFGDAYYAVKSTKFGLDDYALPISAGNKDIVIEKYKALKNINFKAYYFIYNREEYYDFDSEFTRMEYNKIQDLSDQVSGIRLYRNGFRVFPYGEKENDWLNINKKIVKTQAEENMLSIPFRTQNLFGFVEVIDTKGEYFEETASREGLIENSAFIELQDFVFKALKAASLKIASAEILVAKKREKDAAKKNENIITTIKQSLNDLNQKIKSNDADAQEILTNFLAELPQQIEDIQKESKKQIDENSILRVLATMGLTIGEFLHEIEQFNTQFDAKLFVLKNKIRFSQPLDIETIEDLDEKFKAFQSYTGYFSTAISQNNSRNKKYINIKDSFHRFRNDVLSVNKNSSISIEFEFKSYDLITCPMHTSEWSSIFLNLYNNSKKAILRAKSEGKIRVEAENKGKFLLINFMDNGDGIADSIKDRIFEPFFTTSSPKNPDYLDIKDDNSGSGLGLYIVKNILKNSGGDIQLCIPSPEFKTCFQITIPSNIA